MKTYETDKDYDLIIAVMDGREKAEEFFTLAKSKEADGAFHVKEAATFHRDEHGKIRLNNKGYVAGWKGGGIGLGIGILLGGPLGFAAAGGLLGYLRGQERRELRDKVNAKLGAEQSAIALMLDDPIDWDVVREIGNTFSAELLYAELRGETLVKTEELAEDEDVQKAFEEEIGEVVAD
ncbi:MAG: hypothetical protein OES13_11235 [Acidimicrobiia bacterium]|nr:hypothetical protein [Acidimicrobiia bacterium]